MEGIKEMAAIRIQRWYRRYHKVNLNKSIKAKYIDCIVQTDVDMNDIIKWKLYF